MLQSVPNCDQRVVLVTSPDGGTHEEEGVAAAYSSAQHALLRVYDKLSGVERRLQEEQKYKGSGVESTGRDIVQCSMLAPTKLIGGLMGRKGAVIQDIRTRTGTRITVFRSPSLPPCAAPTDELIQISGSALAVRKAVLDVSFHLQVENRKLDVTNMNRASTSLPPLTNVEDQHTTRCSVSPKSLAVSPKKQNYSVRAPNKRNYSISAPDGDTAPSFSSTAPSSLFSSAGSEISEEISFRLLCSNDAIGGIMGRGGSVVLAMEKETGASITVSPPVRLCGERVITICASENPQTNPSPAQEAVCRVFTRSEKMEAGIENGSGPYLDNTRTVTARLLVPYNNIGCIMGVGGSIISEIRRQTSTHITIIVGGFVPAGVNENNRIVKVSGLFNNVLEALFDITTRLRHDIFSRKNSVDNAGTESHSATSLDSHKPAEWHLGRSQNANHHETITDSMNHLRVDNDVSHSCFPHKWDRKTSGAAVAVRGAIIEDTSHLQVENGKLDVANLYRGATSPSVANVEDRHTTLSVSHGSVAFNTEKQDYSVPAPDGQKCCVSEPDYDTTPSLNGTAIGSIRSSAGGEILEEISFRLLCSNDAIGGVIGRGGSIVKAMENETGTSIRVSPPVRLCDERVITISASEDPHTNLSPAQDAVCQVFTRIVEASIENGPGLYLDNIGTVTARLLVPYSNIGCIMGVGGSIISEIRKKTSAHIIVITGSLVPACASENERVVKVSGLFNNVLDALLDITTRLRREILVNKNSTDNTRTEFHSAKNLGSYKSAEWLRRRNHNANHHATITDNMTPLRLDNDVTNSSFPRKWAHKNDSARNQRRTPNQDLVISQETEAQRGNEPFHVTNTTLQLTVPADMIGKIYGEGGVNLDQIKEISGAEVAVQEPESGGSEGIVTISGAPDRVFAAQSLLHSFSSWVGEPMSSNSSSRRLE